ncbi:MAG: hypothetical protein E7447_00230 [Ruminococcaceae bacterium]|nr:hypothetical protein [Oscillospiraceae bacterium]
MLKRSIAVILLVVMVGGLLIACEPEKEPISQAEAVNIVMKAMDVEQSDNPSIHVHQGVQAGKDVFNVYITVGNVSKTYVVAVNGGDILAIFDGAGHSH